MSFLQIIICSCIVGAAMPPYEYYDINELHGVYGITDLARTEAEVKAYFLQQSMECTKDYPVTAEEITKLNKHEVPDTTNAKCLLACVFRRTNWMDDKGTFLVDNAYALSKEKHPDDAAKLESAKKLFDICKQVNEETFSDGEKGCEKAAKLTKCLTENAPKLGFVLED